MKLCEMRLKWNKNDIYLKKKWVDGYYNYFLLVE